MVLCQWVLAEVSAEMKNSSLTTAFAATINHQTDGHFCLLIQLF